MQALKNSKAPRDEERLICGLFSKKEAASFIGDGARHVHSSTLGLSEECARLTRDALDAKTIPTYPWERDREAQELVILSSRDRYEHIQSIVRALGPSLKRDLREKLGLVIEELVTNAIYHAYRKPDGTARYARRDAILLTEAEKIAVRFHASPEGVYLKVSDQGGCFRFPEISRSFARCYGDVKDQIEAKESGAGLGIYMAFETLTHLKIVTRPNNETCVSCWLPEKGAYDRDAFSFNYFERR